jgi:predicted helicase
VYDVLKAIRDSNTVNRNRGTRFEELMVQYLSTDPQWTEQFTRIWMWCSTHPGSREPVLRPRSGHGRERTQTPTAAH